MTRFLTVLALAGLAACGIDGEPSAPTKDAAAKPGITISGRAEVGVAKSW